MSSRSSSSKLDAEKKKLEQAKLQEQLVHLLKEEENRYCADCDAKGPRWASWNLGIFLCIRCAGIHRNLGVHISKVKSVNLDSWTPENVQSMRVIGNSTARGVYEANLPEHFRRPQSDSSMESFIRAKYDQKRYIMKDWVKPRVEVSDLPCWDELQDIYKGGSGTKKGTAKRQQAQQQSAPTPPRLSGPSESAKKSSTSPAAAKSPAAPKATPSKPSSALGDLVSLDTPRADPAPAKASSASAVNDLLDLVPSPAPTLSPGGFGGTPTQNGNNGFNPSSQAPAATSQAPTAKTSSDSQELFKNIAADGDSSGTESGGVKSKVDIMALYGSKSATTPTSNPASAGGFGSYATAPSPNYQQSPMMGGYQGSPQPQPTGYYQSQFPGQQHPQGQQGQFQPAMSNQGFQQQQRLGGMVPNAAAVPHMMPGAAPGGGFGGFSQFQGHPATSPGYGQYPAAGMGMPQMQNYGMPSQGGMAPGVNPYGMQGLPQQMGSMQIGQPAPANQGNTFSTNLWQ